MVESRNSFSVADVTPKRWKEIEAVFEQALELPANERGTFLEKGCNGDEELRREVESLLESHSSAGDFIDERCRFFSEEDFKDDAVATDS